MAQVFSSVDTATLIGTTTLDPMIGMAFGETVNVETEIVTADEIIEDDIPDDDIQRAARRAPANGMLANPFCEVESVRSGRLMLPCAVVRGRRSSPILDGGFLQDVPPH